MHNLSDIENHIDINWVNWKSQSIKIDGCFDFDDMLQAEMLSER